MSDKKFRPKVEVQYFLDLVMSYRARHGEGVTEEEAAASHLYAAIILHVSKLSPMVAEGAARFLLIESTFPGIVRTKENP